MRCRRAASKAQSHTKPTRGRHPVAGLLGAPQPASSARPYLPNVRGSSPHCVARCAPSSQSCGKFCQSRSSIAKTTNVILYLRVNTSVIQGIIFSREPHIHWRVLPFHTETLHRGRRLRKAYFFLPATEIPGPRYFFAAELTAEATLYGFGHSTQVENHCNTASPLY